MPEPRFEKILGVRFINASALEAIEYLEQRRGYLVVPAAAALPNIERDAAYRQALVEADLAIADSGFMVLLWLAFRWRKVSRVSGLRYLQMLLRERAAAIAEGGFFVLPNEQSREKTLAWFESQRVSIKPSATYIAPLYGQTAEDPGLVEILDGIRPSHVVIAVGGGTQEKLGFYLRENLSYRPAIHCIGAALGFITGDQTAIPDWADRFYLGWLLRFIAQPRLFAPRVLMALRLPALIIRHGRKLPPLTKH